MKETNGNSHDVVSSDSEQLVLVDESDRVTGSLDKASCHDGDGVLHRAFSVFIFNGEGELLLQQRSGDKRLWPLYWSNSCCSHPRVGETMQLATERRLQQELGIGAELEFVYKFSYHARYDDTGAENELCSVYLGRTADTVNANRNEVAAIRYISPALLEEAMNDDAERFTPWFKMEWRRLQDEFSERLGSFCRPAG